jgi:hypothetical protein
MHRKANVMKNKKQTGVGARLAMVFAGIVLGSILWSAGSSCQAQDPPPNLPAGVQDIIKLSKAGITEDVVLAQVKNAGVSYNLSADQIIYLSNQGVSQNVIKALLQSSGTPAPANTSPTSVAPVVPAAPPGTAPGVPPGPTPGAPSVTAPPGTPPVSYDYFHDQLASAGTWMDMPGYGWSWRPSVAATDPFWRPYCDAGHWVYSDAGWFWQSDYPWGEIVFHYGRWHRDSIGWVWIPGYDWAPGWVCWRQSEGYCGWAPLPPAAVFKAGVGLTFGGRLALDVDFGLGVDAFTFVAFDHFWDHNLHAYLLPRERLDFVFRRSFVVNGYRLDHGRFIIEGLGRDRMATITRHSIVVESPVFRDARITGHVEAERRFGRDDRKDHDRF